MNETDCIFYKTRGYASISEMLSSCLFPWLRLDKPEKVVLLREVRWVVLTYRKREQAANAQKLLLHTLGPLRTLCCVVFKMKFCSFRPLITMLLLVVVYFLFAPHCSKF